MSKKWQKTASVIGVEAIETSKDGVYFTNEQIDAVDAALTAPNTAVEELARVSSELATAQSNLTAEITARTTAENNLAAANTTLTAAQQRVTDLTAENETLKAKLSGKAVEETDPKRTGLESNQTKKLTGTAAWAQKQIS